MNPRHSATIRRSALFVCLLLSCVGREASAQTVRAATEVGAYQDTTATSVLTPTIRAAIDHPTAGWNMSGQYLVDVVTAASPDIVSTASPKWTEVRHAGNLGFAYKPSTLGANVGASVSSTPDYLSVSGSAGGSVELDDKHMTLSALYAYGHDVVGRTGTSFDTFSRTLDSHAFIAGISRIVNASLVISGYADVILERGDGSKPYRYVPMFARDVAGSVAPGASFEEVANRRLSVKPLEQLPLARDRYAVTVRLAQRSGVGTFRLEERAYRDSWNMWASTSDLKFLFDVSSRLVLWPHARFHIQTPVNFWQRAYGITNVAHVPEVRTGDRELGPLTTLGGGAGIRLRAGSDGNPDGLVFAFSADAYWTHFSDALFLTDRVSGLGVFSCEVEL